MKDDTNKIFAERLAHYLEKNDMTNNDLAKKIGVTQAMVGQWKSGKHSPRMDKVDKICDVFGCTRAELLDQDVKPGTSEKYLFDIFDELDDEKKKHLIAYAEFLMRNDM